MSTEQHFEGVITPLVTPLTDDRALDTNSLHHLIDYQIASGVHGIFILGSTGEAAYLSRTERLHILKECAQAVAHRVPLLVGILDCNAEQAIELAHHAAEVGADALVICPPYYFIHSQNEIVEFFRHLHHHSPLPLCAYNVPAVTQVHLTPQTVLTMAAENLIVALKDSSSDLSAFRTIIVQRPPSDRLRLFTGLQDVIDVLLFLGAEGMIPGLANGLPRPFVDLYDATRAAQWETARQIQERILPLLTLRLLGDSSLSAAAAAIGAHKTILKLKGIILSTQMALPLSAPDPVTQDRIAVELRAHGML